MKVLVDTSVWSLALRRRSPRAAQVTQLECLIEDGRAALIGAIRQEILSGLRHADQFVNLRKRLRAFSDLSVGAADYERAAEHFNACRKKGVQGSSTDFLICAVAERHDLPILTTDEDFLRFARHLPIRLHPVEVRSALRIPG